MIIECPACSTRYDIKAQLPPEGRTVRCAKCSAVWRAMPAGEEVPLAGASDETGASGPEPGAWPQRTGSWGNSEEAAAPPQASAHEPEPGENGIAGYAVTEGFAEEDVASPPSEPAGARNFEEEKPEQEQNAGKVRWFGSFIRKNSQKSGHRAEPVFEAPQPFPAAETIPFPRPAADAGHSTPPEDDYRTLDNARAAVRNVFASLGEQRPHITSIIQAPVTAQSDAEEEATDLHSASHGFMTDTNGVYDNPEEGEPEQESAGGWESEATTGGNFPHSPGQTGFERAEAWHQAATTAADPPEPAAPKSWLKGWHSDTQDVPEGWQADDEADGSNDMDAQLRDAMRAHFPTHASPAHPAQAKFEEELEAAADETPVAEALTSFWKRSPAAPAEPLEEFSALPDEESSASDADSSFDERLYREIEETREHAKQSKRAEAKGGLALIAAWGLFLCVAGGLSAGLFAFRDIAADALPGLAPFYRALGMPVTVQPLIFEGVQYDWTVSENKPVLHIKGAVYNRANRNVKVPDFVISVKDDDPALDRELPASLPVEGPKIGPDERSDFEIELLSPSPSITSVELELRNVR
ncbi:MAG: zinc-ribbon domain-containing protein [Rhodomicrobium sp.]